MGHTEPTTWSRPGRERHELRGRLADIVGGEALTEHPEARGHEPWLTVRPADTAAVQAVVAAANEMGTPLAPVSSGEPHINGASQPSVAGAVQVDLRRLDRILWVDRRNRIALIEPGVTYEQLIPALAAEGLRIALPLLPRRSKSVLASLLEREPILVPRWHWNPMEPLRSLEVVWGNGDRLLTGSGTFRGETAEDWDRGRIPVTGGGPGQLDFFRLLSGAQGTMGIATWASVKCEPLSEAQQLRVVPAERLEDLIDLTYELLRIRFADELFVANATLLAMLLTRDAAARTAMVEALPPWCLVLGVGGGSVLAAEKVAARTTDIEEIVGRRGMATARSLPGRSGDELLALLQSISDEPCWRRPNGATTREVFFLSPLAHAARHVATVDATNVALADPVPEIGIYLQPIHMGAGCHCEFIVPYDSSDAAAAAATESLCDRAGTALFEGGAYFSRPYGPVTRLVFEADPPTRDLTRTMKGIFDPNDIMNPGRLCFPRVEPLEADPDGTA